MRIAALTDRLAAGLAELIADRPLRIASAPGLLTLFFSAEPVADFAGASACDLEAHARFCRAMLERGDLPAAVPVRGLVRLARPRRGGDRPHARRRLGVARGGPLHERAPADALTSLAALLRDGGDADRRPRRRLERGADLRPARRREAPAPRPRPAEYALVVEAVREGYLLHYGEPRLLAGHDSDLGLLAGDYLYALGIERLAALGDTEAVLVLADLISACAHHHAEGSERPGAGALAERLGGDRRSSRRAPPGAAGNKLRRPRSG